MQELVGGHPPVARSGAVQKPFPIGADAFGTDLDGRGRSTRSVDRFGTGGLWRGGRLWRGEWLGRRRVRSLRGRRRGGDFDGSPREVAVGDRASRAFPGCDPVQCFLEFLPVGVDDGEDVVHDEPGVEYVLVGEHPSEEVDGGHGAGHGGVHAADCSESPITRPSTSSP